MLGRGEKAERERRRQEEGRQEWERNERREEGGRLGREERKGRSLFTLLLSAVHLCD